jgi:hypothetical protein
MGAGQFLTVVRPFLPVGDASLAAFFAYPSSPSGEWPTFNQDEADLADGMNLT